ELPASMYAALGGGRQTLGTTFIHLGTCLEVRNEIRCDCQGSNDTTECRNDIRPESAARRAARASWKRRGDARTPYVDGASRLPAEARTLAYRGSSREHPCLRTAQRYARQPALPHDWHFCVTLRDGAGRLAFQLARSRLVDGCGD